MCGPFNVFHCAVVAASATVLIPKFRVLWPPSEFRRSRTSTHATSHLSPFPLGSEADIEAEINAPSAGPEDMEDIDYFILIIQFYLAKILARRYFKDT